MHALIYLLAALSLGGGPTLPAQSQASTRSVQAAAPLTGTTWTLTLIHTGRQQVTLGTHFARPTLRLQGQTAQIVTPCGAQTVPFTRAGAALRFPAVGTGASACQDAALAMQEDYLALLRRTTRYTIQGSTLTLYAGTGRLVFQATAKPTAPTPGGTVTPPSRQTPSNQMPVSRDLAIASLKWNGKVIPVPAGARVQVTTGGGGKITLKGKLGCNAITAEGTLTGSVVRFGDIASTRMMCEDMAAETAFLNLLREPLTVSGRGDAPLWLGAHGSVQFAAPAAPTTSTFPAAAIPSSTFAVPSGTFTLTRVNGQAAPALIEPITIAFENGRIGGNDGCNMYSAPYTVAGNVLKVGQLVSTLMACPDAEKVNLLALLGANPTANLNGSTLTLTATGQVWEFMRKP